MAKKVVKEEKPILTRELAKESEIKNLMIYPYASPIQFDELDEDILIGEIEKEITVMKTLRGERCLEEKWQEGRDQYDGVVEFKDFPFVDCSNLHIHITSMSTDVLKTKSKMQIFGPAPMMMLRPLPGQEGDELFQNVKTKEQYLDYKVREEIGIETQLDGVIKDAINLGTGIAKISYLRDIDYSATSFEIYEATPEDIYRFETDFSDDKDGAVYKQYMKDLKDGLSVQVWITSDEIVYENPKISYVKLEDLYIRPDVKELRNQRVIAEKIRLGWIDMLNYANQNYFNKEAVFALKEQYKADYWKRFYDLYECIAYYDYEKTNRPKRVKVTYLCEEKKILRLITYPYMHREPDYVLYYIEDPKDGAYGPGLAEKLKHTNKALNSLWNQTIDSGTFRNAPAFQAVKGTTFDPTLKGWGPAVIWWVDKMGDVSPLQTGGISTEVINYIERLERYAEWLTGITSYMTGRESPTDPNAPMGKAYMLLKESNLRVNDSIKCLHNSNKRAFRQIDSLLYQFSRGTKLSYQISSAEKIEVQDISKKVLGLKVQYIPQLSDITINKEAQKQQNLQFGTYLQQNPVVQSAPEAIRTILEIQIRDQGGQWEKNIDKLLPPALNKQIEPKPKRGLAEMTGGQKIPGNLQVIPQETGREAPGEEAPSE